MRPRYESPEDLRIEREAIELFARALGPRVKAVKLEGRIDWELIEDGVRLAWVEVKARGRRYAEMLLSAAKWAALLAVRHRAKLGSFWLVKFPDGLRWTTVEPQLVAYVAQAGRTDRGDPFDIEDCVFIPLKYLEEL